MSSPIYIIRLSSGEELIANVKKDAPKDQDHMYLENVGVMFMSPEGKLVVQKFMAYSTIHRKRGSLPVQNSDVLFVLEPIDGLAQLHGQVFPETVKSSFDPAAIYAKESKIILDI